MQLNRDRVGANALAIEFLQDSTDNWLPGLCSDELPIFSITSDRKILRREFLGKITYHLPETYLVVAFLELGAAFHAAYGVPMSRDLVDLNAKAAGS